MMCSSPATTGSVPFELESVLIEHPAVAEAAVVPAPDAVRLSVPKAYVVLAAGYEPTAETAQAILDYCRAQLAPYKRIRRLEFAELPKTISGKIRRVELRGAENDRAGERAAGGVPRGGLQAVAQAIRSAGGDFGQRGLRSGHQVGRRQGQLQAPFAGRDVHGVEPERRGVDDHRYRLRCPSGLIPPST